MIEKTKLKKQLPKIYEYREKYNNWKTSSQDYEPDEEKKIKDHATSSFEAVTITIANRFKPLYYAH